MKREEQQASYGVAADILSVVNDVTRALPNQRGWSKYVMIGSLRQAQARRNMC